MRESGVIRAIRKGSAALVVLAVSATVAAGRPGAAQEAAPRPAAPLPVAPAPAAPARPAGKPDPRLAQEFTAEVRSASVAEVLNRLSGALDVRLGAEPGLAGQRVTFYARDASLRSFQQALGSLYHTGWRNVAENDPARYRLLVNEALLREATNLRASRRSAFISRLLDTEYALNRQRPDAVAAGMRAAVARRLPYLPETTLNEISPDFVGQALLTSPIRLGLSRALVRNGSVWSPLRRLPAPQQQLLAAYYLEQYRRSQPEARPVAAAAEADLLAASVLNYPQARLEYHLLFGDRWAGNVLLARVGASDNWANAALNSTLFDLPDFVSLYADLPPRPIEAAFYKPVEARIDTNALTWDQALGELSRVSGLNVVSDTYLRPDVFRPAGPGPVFANMTLIQMLDQVSEYYGYAWWKEGNWLVFRNRLWAEQEAVAVPEKLVQSISASLGTRDALSAADLTGLASLTDDQLLTLHLYGSAAGQVGAPVQSYNYEDVSLAHAGLLLLSQAGEAQGEMARGRGLPFSLMSQQQQYVFSTLAYDRGVLWDPALQDEWRLRVEENFRRQRLPGGWAEVGELVFNFDFAPDLERQATLAIRVPAVETPKGKEPKDSE